MDFKVEISCEKCQCSFELRPVEFKIRSSMECPNCGQAFPMGVYEELKAGVTAFGNIPEYTSENNNSLGPEPLFRIRIKSYGILHNMFDRQKD